jgi:hypothetical protein
MLPKHTILEARKKVTPLFNDLLPTSVLSLKP